MEPIIKVNNSTYYLGVNDRQTRFFENLWPIPHGMAYNSYLIKDEKNVLLDTVDITYTDRFLRQLRAALAGEKLDYIIINHMEPDHSGSLGLILSHYPEATLVVNRQSKKMLEGYFGEVEHVLEVSEKETLPIGSRELRFITAPMVHWPEVMFTYDPLEETLFSADAFGSYGTVDGGIFDYQRSDTEHQMNECTRYYSNIVGMYGPFVQKAMKKVETLPIKQICSVHGSIWQERIPEILSLYDQLATYGSEPGLVLVYATMYGHLSELADTIAHAAGRAGVTPVKVYNLASQDVSYAISDIFRYSGVIIGSPTYNNSLYPKIEELLSKLEMRKVSPRFYGHFGTGSWNPNVAGKLTDFGERMKWTTVADPVTMLMSMADDKEAEGVRLGEAMAKAILSGTPEIAK